MPTIRIFAAACAALAVVCTLGACATAPAQSAAAPAARIAAVTPWYAGTSGIAD